MILPDMERCVEVKHIARISSIVDHACKLPKLGEPQTNSRVFGKLELLVKLRYEKMCVNN